MQAIKPLSAVDTIAITQANFPALQHAFTVAGVSGSTLSDQVGNLVITNSVAITTTATTFAFASGNRSPIAGTLFTPGTKDVLVMAIGAMSGLASGWFFGQGDGLAGSYYHLYGNSNAYAGISDSQYFGTFGNSGVTANQGMALVVDNSAPSATRYLLNSGTFTTSTGTNTGAIAGGATWPASSGQDAATALGGTGAWSGVYVFAFTSGNMPSANVIKAAMAWMTANPGKMFPGFLGIN